MAANLTPMQREHRLATIAAMITAGRTRDDICARVGVHANCIREYLRRHSPDLSEQWAAIPRARYGRPRGDLDDIRHLASFGMNIDAIARQLRIKPDSIKRRLQRRGEWELLDSIRTNHQPGRDIYRTRSAA